MTGNELRKSFIEFFKSKQHQHFESASLVPEDKTLLLTVAGMVPFKKVLFGRKESTNKKSNNISKMYKNK